jgi:hypothetical protein
MASKLMVFAKFVNIRQRNNSPNYVEVFVHSPLFLQANTGKVQKSAKLGRVEKSAKLSFFTCCHLIANTTSIFLSSWARSGKLISF